jgi:hypothetical protein
MIHYVFLINRQSKCRLKIFYEKVAEKEQNKVLRDITATILSRSSKMCNFLEYKGIKVVYKKYASLFFIIGIDQQDNEFIALELIQQYVEVLDQYFGSVCELDLVFNFHKAYYILAELIMSGEILETSKKVILQAMTTQDTAETSDQQEIPEI